VSGNFLLFSVALFGRLKHELKGCVVIIWVILAQVLGFERYYDIYISRPMVSERVCLKVQGF